MSNDAFIGFVALCTLLFIGGMIIKTLFEMDSETRRFAIGVNLIFIIFVFVIEAIK